MIASTAVKQKIVPCLRHQLLCHHRTRASADWSATVLRDTTVNDAVRATFARSQGTVFVCRRNDCAARFSRRAANLWITTSEFRRAHFRNAGNGCSKITESFS
jgi:hypothetical protein